MPEPVAPLGPANRHYWLALRMAKATGADLARAMEEGEISPSDWADLVQRCRGCAWAGGCDCWMAAQEDGAAEVPAACPNAEVFERIKDGLVS